MSSENVEVVRRVYEAAARRDTETVLALYDPGIEWDGSRHPMKHLINATFRGHAGLRRWAREWHEVWEDYEDILEELIDAGEHVVSISIMRGRGRGSGLEVDSPRYAGVWTIRDGKVTRVVWFGSRAEALEAAGLSE